MGRIFAKWVIMNFRTIFNAKITQKKKKRKNGKYARNDKILKGGENIYFKFSKGFIHLDFGKLRLWKKEHSEHIIYITRGK